MTVSAASAATNDTPARGTTLPLYRTLPPLVRPSWLSFVVPLSIALLVSHSLYRPSDNPVSWFTTFAWALPILVPIVALKGIWHSRRSIVAAGKPSHEPVVRDQRLIVPIPTVGRADTYPALERVVMSFAQHLPQYFPNHQIEVVVEEGCEAMADIIQLVGSLPRVRLVMVPADYQTPKGTRFKARASCYALELRNRRGESDAGTWILHMDDDTAAGQDTIREVARWILENGYGRRQLHLAQGVLTYVRARSPHYFAWLADAVRPSDDLARFAAVTGGGTPVAGVHGELLLVRASIVREIGWDFGPDEITEDARFALTFSHRYPGRSGWFPGRCYGASPASIRDFMKQRTRWAEGLVALVCNGALPLKQRLFLAYCVSSWVMGPLQHITVVLFSAFVIGGSLNTSPILEIVAVLWDINLAYVVWMYWEGLKVNSRASGLRNPRPIDRMMVIACIPLFALWEGISGLRGALRHFMRIEKTFTVISKPH